MASISKILRTLENRGIVVSNHELNISILYSSIDSIYYRLDNGKVSKDEARTAVEKAIKLYQEHEAEKPEDDDIL